MRLEEIATKLRAHLNRWELDPRINVVNAQYGTRRFFNANAYASGPRLFVCYVSYQYTSSLKKAEALEYLAWIEAGNVGTHYEMKHSKSKEAHDE